MNLERENVTQANRSEASGQSTQKIVVGTSLLKRNDEQAHKLRENFSQKSILVVNLLSSPGSGKTSLLEKTLIDLQKKIRMGVVVGDLQTDRDAQRLQNRGAGVVAITTGTVCHLEAAMVSRSLSSLDLDSLDLLFIENVGNLVCPARFDLGEDYRIVILSTTEGEDKPLKYPFIFQSANLVLINKMDLAELADFNMDVACENIKMVAPQAMIIPISVKKGLGLADWYQWLLKHYETKKEYPINKFAEAVRH